MNRIAKFLTLLVVSISFCEMSTVDASIFDKIKTKISKTKDKAKEKIKSVRNTVSKVSSKVKTVATKAGQIAKKIQDNKEKIAGFAGAVGISNEKMQKVLSIADKVKDKSGTISQKIDNLKLIKEEEKKEEDKKEGEGTPTDEVSHDETSPDDTQTGDEAEEKFPEEVISKIDKMFSSKEEIEKLKKISFEGYTIEEQDIPYLSKKMLLLAKEGLKKIALSFHGCTISSKNIIALLDNIKSQPQFIYSMNLSGNSIGDDGAIAIASILDCFPMLKYIFMPNSDISGVGAVNLLSVCAKLSQGDGGTSLQLIDMSNNKITDEFVKSIIDNCKIIKEKNDLTIMLHDNLLQNTQAIDTPYNIKLALK